MGLHKAHWVGVLRCGWVAYLEDLLVDINNSNIYMLGVVVLCGVCFETC